MTRINKIERRIICITLIMICGISLFDLITDLDEGVTWWHVSVESFVILIGMTSFIYLLKGNFTLKHKFVNEKILSGKLKEENDKYKEQSKIFITGLSSTIEKQLKHWQLSNSEKEVAFLLLKGLSLKEIAQIRGTTEKTTRTQSAAIYNKAGLSNRSQLAAFFLEDLFVPVS